MRNPVDEQDIKVPQSSYIPTALSQFGRGSSIKAANLSAEILGGGRYIIYGDYGSGKSMTLRDIYYRIRDHFRNGESRFCPVYINLRDHVAQPSPDEVLYRHAHKIGFESAHSLINSWRAGFLAVILDGFDELTPPQFAASVTTRREARRFAVQVVRRFFDETPAEAPVIVAGRESYFDDRTEACNALGYPHKTKVFELTGFTDEEIKTYLKKKEAHLPDWLPTRPLLLGYLANSGFLDSDNYTLPNDPAIGWDLMLQRVCEREVNQIWGVGFEASSLRLFIEGLASNARRTQAGALEDSDLRRVFRTVFGRDADEPANLLTGRLPGLGSIPGRPGAREFIDADLADAASSGDLARFISNPFVESTPLDSLTVPLGDLGREMVVMRVKDVAPRLSIAISKACQIKELETSILDMLTIMIENQMGYRGSPVIVKDMHFDKLIVDMSLDWSNFTFESCTVQNLEIVRPEKMAGEGLTLKLDNCLIDKVEGAVSLLDLPKYLLSGTTEVKYFATFSDTNDAVMMSALPDSVKVLLTILRKLFVQSVTGRKYNALNRGLQPKMVKYVAPIVALIKTHQFASDARARFETVLIPHREKRAEAIDIIMGPHTSNHPLVLDVRRL